MMKQMARFFSSILLILALATPQAHARVVRVAQWGQDSGYCGAANDPCRTINQAIENAAPGSTIRVGPGIYGDTDGDGRIFSPGEESRPCGGWASIVCVDKKNLKLESTMGAANTVINGTGSTSTGVAIRADGVSFGKKGKGFTVRNATRGVLLDADRITVRNIRAEDNTAFGFYGEQSPGQGHYVLIGNSAVRDHQGFYFRATQNEPYVTRFSENRSIDNDSFGARLFLRSAVTVEKNVLLNNESGIILKAGGGAVVKNNLAVGNTDIGFSVAKWGKRGSVSLIGNSAARNGSFGFHLTGIDKFQGNVSTNNDEGLYCLTVKMQIVKNSITGNGSYGITVDRNGPGAAGIVLEKNNIYGNGWDSGNNCGLRNDMGGAISVRKNFWGDPAGPGADPADNTCGSPVTAVSPLKKPIKVKVKTPVF